LATCCITATQAVGEKILTSVTGQQKRWSAVCSNIETLFPQNCPFGEGI